MSIHVRIEVSCPKCIQSTVVDSKKIPEGRLKVVCRKCCHQFPMDRGSGLNCKIRTMGGAPLQVPQPAPENMEWLVEARMCKGFQYDIKGLGVLVRGGVINRHTRVKTAGSNAAIPAGRLVQLKPFFDEADKARALHKETDTDMTLDGRESTSNGKAWYEMDCSDFFEDKVLPFLSRDQHRGKRAAG